MGASKGSLELKFTKYTRFTEFWVLISTTEIIPWLNTVLPPQEKRERVGRSSVCGSWPRRDDRTSTRKKQHPNKRSWQLGQLRSFRHYSLSPAAPYQSFYHYPSTVLVFISTHHQQCLRLLHQYSNEPKSMASQPPPKPSALTPAHSKPMKP